MQVQPPAVALGFHGGLLYGWNSPDATTKICPRDSTNTTVADGTICLYTSQTFTNENWQFQGHIDAFLVETLPDGTKVFDFPAEILFTPASCNGVSYKYIYMWDSPRIMRATSASTDWHFSNVGSSSLPNIASQPDTAGRIGSLAIGYNGSGGLRLFYGNYNSHQSQCPQALVWESDCTASTAPGDSWAVPIELAVSISPNGSANNEPGCKTPYSSYYHGREVHSIEVDPANGANVYVTVDTEGADPQTLGLWRSTDGGNTFSQLTPNSSFVGINFVFPQGSDKIFLEPDGCAGYPIGIGCGNTPYPNGGPLISWDKVSGGAFSIVDVWPTPMPAGSAQWSGSGEGIASTSEQNIFLANVESQTNRFGIWYFAPPNYNTPVLLEDLAPPISSITANSGTVTVTTFLPHGILYGSDGLSLDLINITGVMPSTFNLAPVQVTVTSPTTFTYSCSNCSGSGSGGFATKNIDWLWRTFEVTDTSGNTPVTYLYHFGQKIVKPIFYTWHGSGELPGTAADSASPLAGYQDGSGNVYLLYRIPDSGGNMEVVSCGSSGCQATDLSALNGTAAPVSQIVQPSPGAFYYLDGNGKLCGIFAPRNGGSWTGTGELPGSAADAGTPLAGYQDSSGNTYLLYRIPNSGGNMEVVSNVNGVWQATNLSIANGTPAPISQIAQPSPGAFYYLDGNGKAIGIFAPAPWNGGQWVGTGELPGSAAATGSPFAAYANSSGNTYLLYRIPDNGGNMEVVSSSTSGWQATNLSVANGTPPPISQIVQPSPGAFYYLDGRNGQAIGIFAPQNGGGWTGTGDLPGQPAASGSPLAGFVNSSGITYLLYRIADNGGNMELVSYINGAWQANNLSMANGTAAPVSQIIQTTPGAFYYLDGNGKINGVFAP